MNEQNGVEYGAHSFCSLVHILFGVFIRYSVFLDIAWLMLLSCVYRENIHNNSLVYGGSFNFSKLGFENNFMVIAAE